MKKNEEKKEKVDLNNVNPVCPYCKEDPVLLISRRIRMDNGELLTMVFCGNLECRHLFTIAPTPPAAEPNKHPGVIIPS